MVRESGMDAAYISGLGLGLDVFRSLERGPPQRAHKVQEKQIK